MESGPTVSVAPTSTPTVDTIHPATARLLVGMSDHDRDLVRSFIARGYPKEKAIYAVWRARAGAEIRDQREELEHANMIRSLPGWMLEATENRKKPLGRNSKCPCGSGRRVKKCCLHKRREAAR